MQKFKSVEELINQLKPEKPVYCIRKNSIQSAVKYFKNNFPGKILYAVKTNPHPEVIKKIIESGVNQFDVASIEEIKSIKDRHLAEETKTLDILGKELKISKERVRQIEKGAMMKLKSYITNSQSKDLLFS